jgi:hypothetical protein
MMDTISYQFYGDKKTAYTGSSFYMWLPSALSNWTERAEGSHI